MWPHSKNEKKIHRIGGIILAYATNPRYAQLYFYDMETAMAYQMQNKLNADCDSVVMKTNEQNIYVSWIHI